MPFLPLLLSAAPPPAWLLLPFVAMLLAIALLPFAAPRHWEERHPWWALVLGALSAGYYLFIRRDPVPVLHAAHEYVSFLVMIGSLFVVAGGIHLVVKGEARPWMNLLFLALASVVSNLIGTTGASMLLIRPWIRMNKYRITNYHIVFFIFLVSNVSGCLTPIGDPPLFLGFLKGIPFWWTLQHCWRPWAFGVLALLGIFYVLDVLNFHKAPRPVRERATARETWRFGGLHNLLFLGMILGSVFVKHPAFLREGIMAAAALASWATTRREVHLANDFTMGPVKEVAWLFLGIFATMIPALQYLQVHAASLGLRSEWDFYWATGLLSGVLDNAPTFLAFLATAFGLAGLDLETGMPVFLASHAGKLAAISVSAVFFGAMTYIGNGPNFMVKAIADRAKVETPGFFGYVLRYALPFLLPVLFLVGILFFSSPSLP
ncbi:MAG: sodium:proton antiporter [Chthoniobacteraceae bacterium]|nr:sodium:proton antiporter [Chthoniobacteraceae bacterium]